MRRRAELQRCDSLVSLKLLALNSKGYCIISLHIMYMSIFCVKFSRCNIICHMILKKKKNGILTELYK